jgi:hypothetical protein
MGKINKAIEHKKPWQNIADECELFYSAASGFLFDPKYKSKFWDMDGGEVQPRFRLTVARAFELVALFGPALYWRNPVRTAEVRQMSEIDPAVFGPMMDPQQMQQIMQAQQMGQPVDPMQMQAVMAAQQAQAMYQQVQQEYQVEIPARRARAELMSRYLNWTPNVLSLHREAELAITQALVAGRGVLWTLPYQPPGSQKIMVGSFYDPVENLLIDPDSDTFESAWWIARKCIEPVWKIERDRGMRPGTLARYATHESAMTQGESQADDLAAMHRAQGRTHDLMVYYKVFSRCGLARLSELKTDLKEKIEAVTGDYVYLEVAASCPFPLNATSERIQEMNNEDVRAAFQWPTPFWKRDRWPCAVLDFYAQPKKAWPIAPLAPGLGELKALQVLFSHMVNKIWMSQRDFIVYSKAASDEIRKIIEQGKDLSFLPLETVHNSISEVIQFLQHPPVNPDAWKIMDALLEMFDRRTGLTDLLYGVQQIQSRSATDVQVRQQATSVRPEYMASKVESWMSLVAKNEAFTTRWYVQGQDVVDLMGRTGAMLWDSLITGTDVERTIDEIDYSVEASSAQRPNMMRDMANMEKFIQTFGPLLSGHADVTGDTTPLNNLMKRWGKIAQMDVSDLLMGPRQQPGMDPAAMQQAQMQQEQAERQAEMQMEQERLAMEQQAKQQDLFQDQQSHQQEMAQDQERHILEMRQIQERAVVDQRVAEQRAQQERREASQRLALQRQEAEAKRKAQQTAARDRQPSRNGGSPK